jgi:hypothetical protein
MTNFALKVIHKPTGEATLYGPWPTKDDPVADLALLTFYQGFACGWHAHKSPEGSPEDLEFETVEVPEEAPEEPAQGNISVGVTSFASGFVTHPQTAPDDE